MTIPARTSAGTPDALELELFRYAALSVVDELEVNLTQTAYSLLIYEYKDYCIGLLDSEFKLIAQSRGSLPIFVADLGGPVRDCVEIIGLDRLERGDIFVSNYGPVSGQHLNNVVVATPIFGNGETPLGYICIRAHWSDIGGLVPGSVSWSARDLFQEGTQYRALRVVRAGVAQPEILATIEANTRMAKHVMGDLSAQIGACQLGVQRWQDRIASRWSDEAIVQIARDLRATSSRIAREQIRALLKDGTYSASCRLDDSGLPGTPPLTLVLSMEVKNGEVVVDLTDMPPQVTAPMNCGEPAALSAIRVGFKALLDPDFPVDEGFFEPISFRTRPGTLVTATGSAPMAFWNNPIASMIDLVFRAFGEKLPDIAPAGHHASMGAYAFFGNDPDEGWWFYMDTGHGGRGGHAGGPGFSPLKTLGHGDTRDIPVEILESRYPLLCHSYEFIPHSGGAGLHRGGDGTQKELEVTREGIVAEISLDRTLDPPWGLAGGEPGAPGDILIRRPGDAQWSSHKKVAQMPMPAGTRVRIRTSGGGGWGTPAADQETEGQHA